MKNKRLANLTLYDILSYKWQVYFYHKLLLPLAAKLKSVAFWVSTRPASNIVYTRNYNNFTHVWERCEADFNKMLNLKILDINDAVAFKNNPIKYLEYFSYFNHLVLAEMLPILGLLFRYYPQCNLTFGGFRICYYGCGIWSFTLYWWTCCIIKYNL